ncbi:uncharacterized protein LOC113383736 isoform X2 [Ctenocephalides felis]|nr:uncharacterized protein LOC113383736 isoform X2 [Ctenocephalides felis]
MVDLCETSDNFEPGDQMKYVIEEDLSQVIKKVQRNRQRKSELRIWEDFHESEVFNAENLFKDHAHWPDCSKSSYCPNILLQENIKNTCSKFLEISLDESNEVNRPSIVEIDSESLPDIRIGETRLLKKQKSIRPKSSPVKTDFKINSKYFVPEINLESLNEELNSEYFDSITELDEDISNNSDLFKNCHIDRDKILEKSRRLSFSTEQILQELYENESDDIESFHDFHSFKMSINTDLRNNSSITNEIDNGKKILSLNDYIIADPFFKDKIDKSRFKIAEALDELKTISPKRYLDADSPEELLKSQKRDIEFYSRFSRNYVYDFQRQIIKLGKLFTAARKTEVLTNETCQKLLVAHQIVLRGLQAYCKHAQTSLIDEIPEKIHEFINDFMKLSEMCIEHGILIEDELRESCIRIMEGPLKEEIDKLKLKTAKNRRNIIKDFRSSQTARIYTSVHDSPYANKPCFKKK